MKYSVLATTLSLTLGGAGIVAAQPADPQAAPTTDTQTKPAAKPTTGAVTTPSTDAADKVQSVDMLFETNSAQLTGNAHGELEKLAQWAACNTKGALILEGHADPRGTQAYNMQLSGERAAAVREKLISMGVASDRIVVTLYGENGPKRATFAEDRRVTVRATSRPIEPTAITAQK